MGLVEFRYGTPKSPKHYLSCVQQSSVRAKTLRPTKLRNMTLCCRADHSAERIAFTFLSLRAFIVPGHSRPVTYVAFDATGKTLYTCGKDAMKQHVSLKHKQA